MHTVEDPGADGGDVAAGEGVVGREALGGAGVQRQPLGQSALEEQARVPAHAGRLVAAERSSAVASEARSQCWSAAGPLASRTDQQARNDGGWGWHRTCTERVVDGWLTVRCQGGGGGGGARGSGGNARTGNRWVWVRYVYLIALRAKVFVFLGFLSRLSPYPRPISRDGCRRASAAGTGDGWMCRVASACTEAGLIANG